MALLKLLGYSVPEIGFKANTLDSDAEKSYQINPKIRMDIKQQDKFMTLSITVTIDNTQPSPTPFELNVNVVGNFLVVNMSDIESLRIEASNMLYPYVRTTVAQITTASNMPSYFLPIIDFAPPAPTSSDSVVIRPLEEL